MHTIALDYQENQNSFVVFYLNLEVPHIFVPKNDNGFECKSSIMADILQVFWFNVNQLNQNIGKYNLSHI